jgi:hypothetical protein
MRGECGVVAADAARQQRRCASAERQPQLRQHTRIVDEQTVVDTGDVAQWIVDDKRATRFQHVLVGTCRVQIFRRDKGAIVLLLLIVDAFGMRESAECFRVLHQLPPVLVSLVSLRL